MAAMQWIKNLIEVWMKPGTPMHDSTVQMVAIVLGAAAYVIHAATLSPLVATTFWEAAGGGATAGLVAIASYHVTTASPILVPGNQAPPQPAAFTSGADRGVFTTQPNGVSGPTLVPATAEKVEVVTPTAQEAPPAP